ncbi:unnamed protein product [Vitrella brassicaformis CCMP3155]|uniref:Uncharacterized protein n=1 Tax=Vitrella brassicaformis (strain CCMP3155) TaxID=1169540 RepID=A0A0G4GJ98_VITBC|nr:unnamed protein product [Vitrella brassicaformis CCMP3155]|eukprot:CEM29968.1 unnamed protein product [Vitrella brassicaformis CCMP3155]
MPTLCKISALADQALLKQKAANDDDSRTCRSFTGAPFPPQDRHGGHRHIWQGGPSAMATKEGRRHTVAALSLFLVPPWTRKSVIDAHQEALWLNYVKETAGFGQFRATHRALLPPCEPQQVMPLPAQPAIDDDQGWTSKMVGLMSRPGNLRDEEPLPAEILDRAPNDPTPRTWNHSWPTPLLATKFPGVSGLVFAPKTPYLMQ